MRLLPDLNAARAGGVALVALAACVFSTTARAALHLTAEPVFSPVVDDDWSAVAVTLEDDASDRKVDVVARCGATSDDGGTSVRMPLELPAGSRKRVVLPVASGPDTRCMVEALEDGDVVASTPVTIRVAERNRAVVATLGFAPLSLRRQAVDQLEVAIAEVTPELLPSDERAWPTLQAIVWAAPRSSDLDSEQAAALGRWVAAGGLLLVGVNPEEPDALAVLHLGDLLPAMPSRGAGLAIVLGPPKPGAAGLTVEAGKTAYPWRYGLGRVGLWGGDLNVAEPPWAQLLDTPWVRGSQRTPNGARAVPRRAFTAGLPSATQRLIEARLPQAPLVGAIVLLVVFAIAVVPVDAYLTRRSLKQGRRIRLGHLRFPALACLGTTAGFVLAGGFGSSLVVSGAVDVVDVDLESGTASARTEAWVARGRSGRVRIEGDDLHMLSADPISADQWGAAPAGATRFEALQGSSGAVPAVETNVGSWQVTTAVARWHLDDTTLASLIRRSEKARKDAPGPCRSESFVALVEGRDSSAPTLSVERDDMADGQPADVVAVRRGRIGPELLVDGRPVEDAGSWTVVRYRCRAGWGWDQSGAPPALAFPAQVPNQLFTPQRQVTP